jgi:4-carboxymuconolactone decarboxylase
MTGTSLPLIALEGHLAEVLTEADVAPADLYRVLANQPALLEGWLRFSRVLRHDVSTPRALRELMILRSAQVMNASYQWRDHREMARAAGVNDDVVSELSDWRSSTAFTAEQRTALALVDAMLAGHVPDEVLSELTKSFSAADALELILTAGFYCMVPRVLDSLRLRADVDVPQASNPIVITVKMGD